MTGRLDLSRLRWFEVREGGSRRQRYNTRPNISAQGWLVAADGVGARMCRVRERSRGINVFDLLTR